MKLKALAEKYPQLKFINQREDLDLQWISENSNLIPEDPWIFVARKGQRSNGWNFAEEAIRKGAKAILSDIQPEKSYPVPVLICESLVDFLPDFFPFFYDYPEHKMSVIGVTGTNGKTTTTYLLENVLKNSARLGTTNIRVNDELFPTSNTTPDLSTIYYYLNLAARRGVTHFIMETTSHAIKMGRLGCLEFDALIFTNLGRDHLDYHLTLEDYEATKISLFTSSLSYQRKKCMYFLNTDDSTGKKIHSLLCSAGRKPCSCSLIDQQADFYAQIVELSLSGSRFLIGGHLYAIPLLGEYNVFNSLLAIACCLKLDISPETVFSNLKNFQGVPGRIEKVAQAVDKNIIIDYAHTPEGLQNVLATLRELIPGEKLYLVFGCGGNRDRGKRAEMAKIAAAYSDFVIVTDDNPRFEEPQIITSEIVDGFPAEFRSFLVKQPRKEAIRFSLSLLKGRDILLVAGKGHENYQEIKGVRYPYSDLETINCFLNSNEAK
ncbi:MAG: UDP-N-acetylmuramoyl-L-alanyl-D-glutamate--2,6-diaminopimelate ligase [Candidatus Wallbacteria bacterium]|nr:UDP-N-acetylmuramoyl-L-alanyl-D-glutamate--2,6-diaminopimelate ligase [Candidatus Wallbacteria bacterium]